MTYCPPVTACLFETSQSSLAYFHKYFDKKTFCGHTVIILSDLLAKALTLKLLYCSLIETISRVALYLLLVVLPDTFRGEFPEKESLSNQASYLIHQFFTLIHQISFLTSLPDRASATASVYIASCHAVFATLIPRFFEGGLSREDIALVEARETVRRQNDQLRAANCDAKVNTPHRYDETLDHLLLIYAGISICCGVRFNSIPKNSTTQKEKFKAFIQKTLDEVDEETKAILQNQDAEGFVIAGNFVAFYEKKALTENFSALQLSTLKQLLCNKQISNADPQVGEAFRIIGVRSNELIKDQTFLDAYAAVCPG